jgi:hypothetical protein
LLKLLRIYFTAGRIWEVFGDAREKIGKSAGAMPDAAMNNSRDSGENPAPKS